MLFSSPFFLFIFLPIFLILYFTARGRGRDYVLLMGSLAFYFWSEPIFCLVALGSSLFDYLICKRIPTTDARTTRILVFLGVFANLALLFYYKYTNFFLSNVMHFISGGKYHFEFLDIILPIGVSFIVFEKITYIVDIARGVGRPANGFINYLNYVFLFPKLLAGPIIKYHEIEQQLKQRGVNFEDVAEGFKRFVRGLIKKVLIADTCGEIANQVFGLPTSVLGFHYAWLGMICFTLQIYFDFSGYSDMALGLARMLGFKLRENFNMPYIAASFTEFWRRWHISLSTWIREYLYIPLGGSRVSTQRMYFNLWICFLLSGLWHGASWTFVAWGAYNGFFLILDRLIWLKITDKIPRLFSASITLFFIMFGWVLFRSNSFDQAYHYLLLLFNPGSAANTYIDITLNITAAVVMGSLLALGGLIPGYQRMSQYYAAWSMRLTVESLLIGAFGFFAICKVVGVSFNPFLYFRF